MSNWKNWRQLIEEDMVKHGETFDDVVASTLNNEELICPFDSGFGGHEGQAFTLWTKKRVYFPVVYDGAEWAASVPRRPCKEKTPHVGGE